MRELFFAAIIRALLLLPNFAGRSAALSQEAACYSPDGVIADGNYPCFLEQEQSACCGAGSICEASGLCRVAGSVGVSDLIRGTCTDSTWASSECPLYCTDADTGGTNLISCQNVTNSNLDFCCDHTNGCCDSGIGRFRVQFNTDVLTLGSSGATISTSAPTSTSSSSVLTTTSSGSSSSPSTSASSSSSSAPSNTSSSSPSNTTGLNTTSTPKASSGLSTGAKIGVGVGCGIVALALFGGLVYFFMKGKSSMVLDYAVEKDGITPPQEMGGRSKPAELTTGDRNERIELPA